MSVFEKELRKRIERDGTVSTLEWFINAMTSDTNSKSKMSSLEWLFWTLIVDGYGLERRSIH